MIYFVLLRKYYCVKLFIHNIYVHIYITIPKKNFHQSTSAQKNKCWPDHKKKQKIKRFEFLSLPLFNTL